MTVTAYPINKKQEKAIKAFFEALEIPFEITKDESPYNPAFVEKMKRGEENFEAGRYKIIKTEDLWK